MTDHALVVIYAALAVAVSAIAVLTLRKKTRRALDNHLLFTAAMLLCWLACMILYHLTSSPAAARLLFDLKLPFVALVVLAWFLYIIRFYGLNSYFPTAVVVSLFVIPAFTAVLAITSSGHDFIRRVMVLSPAPTPRVVVMQRGIWFWYHSLYCYISLLSAFVVAMLQHRKVPQKYRRPSLFLLSGLITALVGNICVVAMSFVLDLSLVSGVASTILLYFATLNYRGLEFLLHARNEAFHSINKALFILDDEGVIVSLNRTAQTLLTQLGLPCTLRLFSAVSQKLEQSALRQEQMEDDSSGVDYVLAPDLIYNLRQRPICDNQENQIGVFVFISDETENRHLIAHLDEHSGLDALTGLSNRRSLEAELTRVDAQHVLPFALVVGDLNNLKEINDRFGHQQGDVCLRVVAEVLKQCAPPNARIARTGGDEFCVLLPGYAHQQTQQLLQEWRQLLAQKKGHAFTPSMAMGFAVKERADQDTAAIMQAADAAMYLDKQAYKKAR